MKIVKRLRRNKKTYKYIKIYFEYDGNKYCKEIKEDFITKTKKVTWKTQIVVKRYYSETHKKKEYEYKEYKEIPTNVMSRLQNFSEKFDKAYELYKFNLREKKLKRITK
ncbi:MAG: hypothetical protein M0R46_11600 [Candidatus Muirbacterium halophilum]|nr:hypothetical protein [Candidatus Muirbacterium halophilum]